MANFQRTRLGWVAACHQSAQVSCRGLVSHTSFLYALCFGIVGLTFKQLRNSWNIGPSEILVLLLAAVVFVSGRWRASGVQRTLQTVTFIFALMTLGTCFALVFDRARVDTRDMVAYPYSFLVISTFIIAAAGRENRALRAMAEVIGFCLLATAVLSPLPGPQQQVLWYVDRAGGLRLRGFSDNPNLIGFLAVAGLGLLFLERWESPARRLLRLVAGIGCALAGAMARSKAFILGLLTIVGPVAAYGCWLGARALLRKTASVSARRQFAAALPPSSLGLLAIVLASLAVPDTFLRALPSVDLTEQHYQPNFFAPAQIAISPIGGGPAFIPADERLALWPRALWAVARSPIIGLGMGAHVVLPPRAFAQEAHNTILDLLLVSGLAGVIPLLSLNTAILIRARVLGRLPRVLLAGAPMAAFAMVHFVGRQPLFWIVHFACACEAGLVRRPAEGLDAAYGQRLAIAERDEAPAERGAE